MSSASSINPGVENLLQTLSNVNSPALSSSKVVSALEKAPARDIVQLSAAATQLENMDAMFGISDSSSSSSSDPLTNLDNLLTQSASSTSSPTDQLADYQATLQAVQTQDLFGTGTANGLSSSLLNLTG
jgi:hypothetical protein